MDALIAKARKEYHSELLHRGVLAINAQGIATNADKDSVASVSIARGIADRLLAETDERIAGQTSGKAFEEITMMFIKSTFPKLQHLRPGKWEIKKLGNRSKIKTSAFAQYEHLAYLTELTKANRKLSAMIGNDYMVAPDIVIYRGLCTDEEINTPMLVVDDTLSRMADLREANGGKAIEEIHTKKLDEAEVAFLTIGRERNRLVHQNYIEVQINDTFEEIFAKYEKACDFVDLITQLLSV